MFVAFVANLARPAAIEADVLAPSLGISPYETRLALAAGPPSVVLVTPSRDRASEIVAALRSRGNGAHVFDEESFVSSAAMTKLDDFNLEPEGVVRRAATNDLLPYGDVYAIVRAVHDASAGAEARSAAADTKAEDREHVAYFFRRSGERPWLLRERHASYVGLGAERTAIAFANFTRTLRRVREASSMAVYDDRLVRRRVAEQGERTSRDRTDLLAHLVAMTIASQGGSPYR